MYKEKIRLWKAHKYEHRQLCPCHARTKDMQRAEQWWKQNLVSLLLTQRAHIIYDLELMEPGKWPFCCIKSTTHLNVLSKTEELWLVQWLLITGRTGKSRKVIKLMIYEQTYSPLCNLIVIFLERKRHHSGLTKKRKILAAEFSLFQWSYCGRLKISGNFKQIIEMLGSNFISV